MAVQSEPGLFVKNYLSTVSTGPLRGRHPYDKTESEVVNANPFTMNLHKTEAVLPVPYFKSHPTGRRNSSSQNVDEKKKDKKWSIGGFFRRRKKEIESESSSQEEPEPRKGFMARRKAKKEEKRKKRSSKVVGTFDHIVVSPLMHQSKNENGFKSRDYEDPGGVFSDPSAGFVGYIGRGLPIPDLETKCSLDGSIEMLSRSSRESLNRPVRDSSLGSIGSGSVDGSIRKSRRERAKARMEAIRDRVRNESSSEDDGSQRSSASSMNRMRSDDSLNKSRDGSVSRRTRTARTERYIRRLSRDDENILNREAEQRTCKSDMENQYARLKPPYKFISVNKSPSQSPIFKQKNLHYASSNVSSNYSGTIPPPAYNRVAAENQRNQQFIFSSQKPPSSQRNELYRNGQMNFQRHVPNEYYMPPPHKSVSYDNNINRSFTSSPVSSDHIIHAQFPVGRVPLQRNPSHNQTYPFNSSPIMDPRSPPPPPPRDPQRKILTGSFENSRPMSYAFENGNRRGPQPVITTDRNPNVRIVNYQPNLNYNGNYGWPQQPVNFRSNSDDHIPQLQYNPNIHNRPASVTPDGMRPQRFITRHGPDQPKYQYFTDQTPRSRKPIHVANPPPVADQPYLSDSQVGLRNNINNQNNPVQTASEFWRRKEQEEAKRKVQEIEKLSKIGRCDRKDNASPNRFREVPNGSLIKPVPFKQNMTQENSDNGTERNNVQPKPLESNSVQSSPFGSLKRKESSCRPLSVVTEKSETVEQEKEAPIPPVRKSSRQSSGSSIDQEWTGEDNLEENQNRRRKKSSNLEDALDELEAIYKSLRLGDEDLLDRAERRDIPASHQKLVSEPFPNWGISRGAQSDTGYSYGRDSSSVESLQDGDIPFRRSRLSRRSCVPDRVTDDMAYRRLRQNERPPSQDAQTVVSQVSYLLASPVLSTSPDIFETETSKNKEPDITLDDVVYRNIKHANNTLKISEHQPPFGIPIGPISPAANSDYLHATPESRPRSRFIPHKSPDIVKDDLAFRNLRKDESKDAALPPIGPEDYVVNNDFVKQDGFGAKKKRAVRSLSANLYGLIPHSRLQSSDVEENEFGKAQSLTDIKDAIDEAQKILRDRAANKQNRIYSNSPTSTETLTESKTNLLSDSDRKNIQQRLRVYIPQNYNDTSNPKPPIPQTDNKASKTPVKELSSTENLTEANFDKEHLEELLTTLANEARATSEKLGKELEELGETITPPVTPVKTPQNIRSPERIATPNNDREIIQTPSREQETKFSDIDAVSEHAKLCEKLLECVVESTDLIAPKTIEVTSAIDSDITELSLEEVEHFDKANEPSFYQSVANVVVCRKPDIPSEIQLDSLTPNRLSTEIASDKLKNLTLSLEDNENPQHDSGIEGSPSKQAISRRNSTESAKSPFEIHKAALIQEFAELKKNLSEEDLCVSRVQKSVTPDDSSKCAESPVLSSPSPGDQSFEGKDDSNRKPQENNNNKTSEGFGAGFRHLLRCNLPGRKGLERPRSCGSLPSLTSASSSLTDCNSQSGYSAMITNGKTSSEQNALEVHQNQTAMARSDVERAERVAKYKEERRRQLANQFGTRDSKGEPSKENQPFVRRYITRGRSTPRSDGMSSGGEVGVSSGAEINRVRTTRASRLRAAASTPLDAGLNTPDNSSVQRTRRLAVPPLSLNVATGTPSSPSVSLTTSDFREKSPGSLSSEASSTISTSRRGVDRDKSSKRKSNLNRSLNAEEVASVDPIDDLSTRRRRRRVIVPQKTDPLVRLEGSPYNISSEPISTFDLPSNSASTSNPVASSRRSPTVSSIPNVSSTPICTSQSSGVKMRKPSELSVHMANARRGIPPSYSEFKDTSLPKRTTTISSPRTLKSDIDKNVNKKSSGNDSSTDKETQRRSSENRFISRRSVNQSKSMTDSELNESGLSCKKPKSSSEMTHRVDALSALTRETLARVERLTGRSKESPRKDRESPRRELLSRESPRKDVTSRESPRREVMNRESPRREITKRDSPRRELINRESPRKESIVSDSSRRDLTANAKKVPISSSNERSSSKSPEKSVIRNGSVPKIISPVHVTNGTHQVNITSIGEIEKRNGIDDSKKTILKKKSVDESVPTPPPPITGIHSPGPVSILKRKSSQDEAGSSGSTTSSFATPPVTFSPSVVDPLPASGRRQGILKKRRSLDESEVLRRRSCSPDVAIHDNGTDFKPILKNKRRSSLEELRICSSDLQPHSILKRKHSRATIDDDGDDGSLESPEPQGILKRKSGSSSSGNSGITPHVSIATAVILAAAGGAEIVVPENTETVKPILKKKSFSMDHDTGSDYSYQEIPRPILKKKSSTDTDDQEDRQVKPILKSSSRKTSSQEETWGEFSENESPRRLSMLRNRSSSYASSATESNENETVKPILKQPGSREHSPRPRLSFCEDDKESSSNYIRVPSTEAIRSPSPIFAKPDNVTLRRSNHQSVVSRSRSSVSDCEVRYFKRRSLPVEMHKTEDDVEYDEKRKSAMDAGARRLSVAERIMKMENFLAQEQMSRSTGAIPKRSSLRSSDRFKTQPITTEEIVASASLESVQAFQEKLFHNIGTTSSTVQLTTSSSGLLLDVESPRSSTTATTPGEASASTSLDLTTSSSELNGHENSSNCQLVNESGDSGVQSKMSLTGGAVTSEDEIEDVDEKPASPVEICRSNSVSAKASLFKQLEQQMKASAEEASRARLNKGGNAGMQRYRSRKSDRYSSGNEGGRFSTQPVTLDEVHEAVRQNLQRCDSVASSSTSTTPIVDGGNQIEASDEADPSKLSLAERVRLFNKKITEETLPPIKSTSGQTQVPLRKRSARFKTQPITSEEVETAQRINPLLASFVKPPDADDLGKLSVRAAKEKMYEHAAKMLTNEVKGILKSKSAVSPLLSSAENQSKSAKHLKSAMKKESFDATHSSDDDSETQVKSILKPDSSKDEGVETDSSDNSNDESKKASRSLKKGGDLVSILHDVGERARLQKLEASKNTKNLLSNEKENVEITNRDNKRGSIKKLCGVNKELQAKFNDTISELKRRKEKKLDSCDKIVEGGNKKNIHSANVLSRSEVICGIKSAKGNLSSSNDTSEGESSGGREVSRIIRNEAVAKRRHAALARQLEREGAGTPPTHSFLSKSKSHSSIDTSRRQGQFAAGVVGDDESSDGACGAQFAASSRRHASVRRSLTQPLAGAAGGDEDMPGASIAERLAALQHSGNNNWRKRVSKNNSSENEIEAVVTRNFFNEAKPKDTHRDDHQKPPSTDIISTSPGSILADRLGKLETASHGWKKRVEQTDAVKFSVAGRMQQDAVPISQLALANSANGDKRKRTPKASRFRSRVAASDSEISTGVRRSFSLPGAAGDDDSSSESDGVQPISENIEGPLISIPRPDDETFTSFFASGIVQSFSSDHLEISTDDFDAVVSESERLLVQRKEIKVQRRRVGGSRNPLRALAARTDLKDEYVEVKSGVAEKELKRLNVEKLSKQSNMAIEALAGLASKEDFSLITLKKARASATMNMLPYKDLMLLHIKGRRHVQTRLVEPIVSSINQGDNYVLVTPTQVFNYVGTYSNIIEQSRGAEVALHIQQHKDLGCSTTKIITIHENKSTCTQRELEQFWSLLGSSVDSSNNSVVKAGHPDEDEIYESSIIDTNMVYELIGDELIPLEDYWGTLPRIEMLDPSKILIFDFGAEMYIWNGKNASLDKRKLAGKLAKELWEQGYDYTDCDICPINAIRMLGDKRTVVENNKKGTERPEWAILAKIAQNMETILFREKFADWPDFSRVIKIKSDDKDTSLTNGIKIKPCDVKKMCKLNTCLPNLELEGSHLGRGDRYFDDQTNRQFEITTNNVTVWYVQEYEYDKIDKQSVGHFYSGDSYVLRWQYRLTVTGRELSGLPSKHAVIGRDRCAYFCWQGKDASQNEKGAAALLTVELDYERGPQVRVTQGNEPPAFLNLFQGSMVIHNGKRTEGYDKRKNPWRLYMVRGDVENECALVEVVCSVRQLRSRASLILINTDNATITVWHGVKSMKHTRSVALTAAQKIKQSKAAEFGFKLIANVTINEVIEGQESKDLMEGLGSGGRQLYSSLLKRSETFDYTPRLFHLSSTSGTFMATEILCPHRSEENVTPYPFLQNDLYSASQPALFLLDDKHTLWLWQGWWPERESSSDSDDNSDQTGSGAHRWQAERRAAMQTAIRYWKEKNNDDSEASSNDDSSSSESTSDEKIPAYLVWAGLEPLEFSCLFPMWTDRDDIAELNIRDGRKPGEILTVESELARLTRSTYPPAVLLQRPLPEGVDPRRLEDYLSPQHFSELVGISRTEFDNLPIWKQTNIKKELGLF